ncbi:hypothetical protein SLA2020_006760 [Shorea laevis]
MLAFPLQNLRCKIQMVLLFFDNLFQTNYKPKRGGNPPLLLPQESLTWNFGLLVTHDQLPPPTFGTNCRKIEGPSEFCTSNWRRKLIMGDRETEVPSQRFLRQ